MVEISAEHWFLGVGQKMDDTKGHRDVLLLPLEGGFECRIESADGAPDAAREDSSIHLRVRFGEILYIPEKLGFSVAEAHSRCGILKLEF